MEEFFDRAAEADRDDVTWFGLFGGGAEGFAGEFRESFGEHRRHFPVKNWSEGFYMSGNRRFWGDKRIGPIDSNGPLFRYTNNI